MPARKIIGLESEASVEGYLEEGESPQKPLEDDLNHYYDGLKI